VVARPREQGTCPDDPAEEADTGLGDPTEEEDTVLGGPTEGAGDLPRRPS